MGLTQQDKNEIKAWLHNAEEELRENDEFTIGFINALNQAVRLYLDKFNK